MKKREPLKKKEPAKPLEMGKGGPLVIGNLPWVRGTTGPKQILKAPRGAQHKEAIRQQQKAAQKQISPVKKGAQHKESIKKMKELAKLHKGPAYATALKAAKKAHRSRWEGYEKKQGLIKHSRKLDQRTEAVKRNLKAFLHKAGSKKSKVPVQIFLGKPRKGPLRRALKKVVAATGVGGALGLGSGIITKKKAEKINKKFDGGLVTKWSKKWG
jgi:hypothetical protein